jgi:hypothetical protein
LSLEPDVALKIKERLAEQQNVSMKDIINQALRIGLQSTTPQAEVRYRVLPHALGLRPGLAPDQLNQILDDFEVSDRSGWPPPTGSAGRAKSER